MTNGSESGAEKGELLKLHVAEYQVLTARCNMWTTLELALVPILGLVIGAVVNAWHSVDHAVLVWGAVFASQILAVASSQILLEHYRTVTYIEGDLCDAVADVLGIKPEGDRPFWGYELYLSEGRSKFLWSEWYIPSVMLIAILVASCLVVPCSRGTWLGLLGSFSLWLVTLTNAICTVRERLRYFPRSGRAVPRVLRVPISNGFVRRGMSPGVDQSAQPKRQGDAQEN
ncbi:MAG: hypothetical protein ACREDR_03880 [Blastocatellia bacterium]